MLPTCVANLEGALAVVEGGEVAGVDLLEHALARQVLLLLFVVVVGLVWWMESQNGPSGVNRPARRTVHHATDTQRVD